VYLGSPTVLIILKARSIQIFGGAPQYLHPQRMEDLTRQSASDLLHVLLPLGVVRTTDGTLHAYTIRAVYTAPTKTIHIWYAGKHLHNEGV